MAKLYLVIHPRSLRAVTRVSDYIWEKCLSFAGEDAERWVVDRVDAVEIARGSTVLIIGEPFGRFAREAGCRYAYLNFSVLYSLGSPLSASMTTLLLQRNKRKALQAKLPSIDFVLDYFEDHCSVLKRNLDTPVLPFEVSVTAPTVPLVPICERPIDVCVVGTATSRRNKLIAELEEFHLSSRSGVILEDEVERSRVTLNVHAHRSNHFEYPRAVAALSRGSVLVTESSFGMTRHIPPDLVISSSYRSIADNVRCLLADDDSLQQTATEAKRWFDTVHQPRSDANWRDLLGTLS